MTVQQFKEAMQQASAGFKMTEEDVNQIFSIKQNAFANGIEFALSHPETAGAILTSLRAFNTEYK